jgi:hypothetical protein
MAAPYRSAYHETLTALLRNDWTRRAACAGQWQVMESPDESHGKAVCSGCPVVAECSAWVMSLHPYEQPDGVVAGMSPRDRKRARRRRGVEKAQATWRAKRGA